MTNIYSGLFFNSIGLNEKSTPNRPSATPVEIDSKLARVSFNGHPWPKSSPVSTVYDVKNTSTRLIMLNNKLANTYEGSRLRGHTNYQGEISKPEPRRHAVDTSHTKWEYHKSCTLTVSEKFVPVSSHAATPIAERGSKTYRPPMKVYGGSNLSPSQIKRQDYLDSDIIRNCHAHHRPRSRVSAKQDPVLLGIFNDSHCRPRSRTSTEQDQVLLEILDNPHHRPRSRTSRKQDPFLLGILNDPQLSRGEKYYLANTAKIYSIENIRQQRLSKYNQLMWTEVNKGTCKERDWEKFKRYLNTRRRIEFQPYGLSLKRSSSAPAQLRKRTSCKVESDERPHTVHGDLKSAKNSRKKSGQLNERSGCVISGQWQGKLSDLVKQSPRVGSSLGTKPHNCPVSSASSVRDKKELERLDKDEEVKKTQNIQQEEKEKDVNQASQDSICNEDEISPSDKSVTTKDTNESVDEVEHIGISYDHERHNMSAKVTEKLGVQKGEGIEYRSALEDSSGDNERSSESTARVDCVKSKDSAMLEQEHKEGKPLDTVQAEQDEKKVDQAAETGQVTNKEVKRESLRSPEIKDDETAEKIESAEFEQAQAPEESLEAIEKAKESGHIFDDTGPELVPDIDREDNDRPMSKLDGQEPFITMQKDDEKESRGENQLPSEQVTRDSVEQDHIPSADIPIRVQDTASVHDSSTVDQDDLIVEQNDAGQERV